MKSNKQPKIFDFTLLQEYQEYDRRTERFLALLTDNYPSIEFTINYLKNAIMPIDEKIRYLYIQLAYVLYMRFDRYELTCLSHCICSYLFNGTEEHRYRKQFAK